MTKEIDEAIKQLLVKMGGFDSAAVDIVFQMPKHEWSSAISKPTINIYLYDVRENHHLRGTEWYTSRDENGKVSRKKNPSRVDLSYMITTWANDIADEHRLLWQVLSTLFRYPELPPEVLSGQLAQLPCAIATRTAQPDGLFSNPADFWSALDNEIKPSVNYVVTVPLDVAAAFTAPEVRTKILEFKPPDSSPERFAQIVGRVYRTGHPEDTVRQATIIAREAGMTALTDDLGQYSFPKIAMGKHTLQIVSPGKKPVERSITVPASSYNLELP